MESFLPFIECLMRVIMDSFKEMCANELGFEYALYIMVDIQE